MTLSNTAYFVFDFGMKLILQKLQGGPKKLCHILLSISSPNIDRFSKFFHLHISWKICNKLVTMYTTTR